MIGKAASDILIRIRGDNKAFNDALKKSDSDMNGFVSRMQAHGPAIAASIAVGAAGFAAMAVKMAAAEEAVSRQTESLLKGQGVMWSRVGEDVNKYMKQLEKLTAYNDTDLQVAFNTMIAAGMSYSEAMENMNTVTSMAYSLNRDLNSMAMLVGKAYNGQTGELSRYGIVLDDTLEKSEKFAGLQEHVSKNFADASERTDSLAGQTAILKNEMSNLAEAFGSELIPGVTGSISELNKLGVTGQDLGKTFGMLAALPFKLPTATADHIRNMREVKKLQSEGVDTESEMIEKLGLQSQALTDISDKEFERKMALLTLAGFHDKTHQLQLARLYGLEQEARALEQIAKNDQTILDIEGKKTNEIKQQLSLMQKFSAHQKSRTRVGTLDLSSLGAFGTTRQSGAFTIRKATESEMSGSRSGL